MELFNVGQRIALLFCKNNNIVEMICNIEKIYDDRFDLVLPQYFMRYIDSLQVGNTLTAKVFSKLGTIDFNTIIISSPLEECFSIEVDYNALKLNPGGETPFISAVEALEVVFEKSKYKLKTFEISTKGIKFYSDQNFNIGNEIDCKLILPKDYGIIDFKAVVTEIDEIYDNEYTTEYITISEKAIQAVLYYMYMYTKDSD